MSGPDEDAENGTVDLQQRDLVIALVALTQQLGHLPDSDEINEHCEYRYQRYQEEFGDLFKAYSEAGILPDDVTRSDFYREELAESPGKDMGQPECETEFGQDEEQDSTETPEASGHVEVAESGEAETKTDVSDLDVDRPNFEAEEDFDESELIYEIQRFGDIIDEPPTEELVVQYGRYPARSYENRFGSWETALEVSRYDPADLPDWSRRKFTNVEILDVVRAVADELGHPPTTIETAERAPFSSGLASIRFGGWATTLKLVGLDPSKRPSVESGDDVEPEETPSEQDGEAITHSGDSPTDRPNFRSTTGDKSINTQEKIPIESLQDSRSRETLLEELERMNESLDRIPFPSDMNKDGAFSAHDYQEEFQSWDAALEAIGVDKEAELLGELQRVTNKLGKKPTQQDMSEHGTYSFGMYANFFGSWSGAKDRLEDQESSPDSPNEEPRGQEEEQKTDAEGDGHDEPIWSVIDDTLKEMLYEEDDNGQV